MTEKDLLIAWLNDAHGMENALIQILEHQIKDAKDYPYVQPKLEQHLEQTRRHAELVKGCIETLGGKTSTVKTGMASLFGQLQALSTGPAKDEMVKNALADYAAENFEVASYTALIRAAQDLNDQQTASVCGISVHRSRIGISSGSQRPANGLGVRANSAGGRGDGPLDSAESPHAGAADIERGNHQIACSLVESF